MPEVRSNNADVESVALLGPADDAMTMMAAPVEASEQRAPLEIEDLVAWVRRAGELQGQNACIFCLHAFTCPRVMPSAIPQACPQEWW